MTLRFSEFVILYSKFHLYDYSSIRGSHVSSINCGIATIYYVKPYKMHNMKEMEQRPGIELVNIPSEIKIKIALFLPFMMISLIVITSIYSQGKIKMKYFKTAIILTLFCFLFSMDSFSQVFTCNDKGNACIGCEPQVMDCTPWTGNAQNTGRDFTIPYIESISPLCWRMFFWACV